MLETTWPEPATMPHAFKKPTLLIEGWRGISHSYCLVNQYQILELLQLAQVDIFHHDVPFHSKTWSREKNESGFTSDAQRKIDQLAPARDARIDCVYRIASPFRASNAGDARRTLTFMVTEFGLDPTHFDAESKNYASYTRDDNAIITPSRWSRDRIVEFGFPLDRVHVVPHGVDTAIFQPLSGQDRAINRVNLGIGDDEALFVNVGGTFWNKGGDLLLRAFSLLRARGAKIRLIIKDQHNLYGVPFETTVKNVGKVCPELLRPETLSAISVIAGNLSPHQLRMLYGIADCYVSPYRAEGFNLPVLEAIACGTLVIATEGGATDDFCPDGVAVRIPGRLRDTSDVASTTVGRYIEPELDALYGAMAACVAGRPAAPASSLPVRRQVLETFSWRHAASEIVRLAVNRCDIHLDQTSLCR